MPPLPAVASNVQVKISGIFNVPGNWLTSFHVAYSGTAPTVAQLSTFNTAINTAFGTNLKSLMNSNYQLTQIESIDLTSPTAAVSTSAFSTAGTRGTTAIPNDSCMVDSLEIARRYRGGHPRMYWPFGITTDIGNPRQWSTAFTTACQTGFNAFFTAVTGATWTGAGTLTITSVSYFKNFTVVINPVTGRARNVPTLRNVPVVDTVVSNVARQSIGTQRRRINFTEV